MSPRLRATLLVLLGPVLLVLPLWVAWASAESLQDLEPEKLRQVAELDLLERHLVVDPGLPFGSDLGFASQSAHNFVESLNEGILYPRWVDSCNRGFGAPTFFFYPPLPYYAVAVASLFTSDVVGAMRLVLAGAAFLAALAFFATARHLTSTPVAALCASLYVLTPFHVLDLYDRFAFASYLAFAWFPLLFLFARRLSSGPDRTAWLGLAVCYAGLVATHLVSAFLVLFVLAPYVLARVAVQRRWRRLLPMATAGVLALLCVSVYLVPLLAHRGDVHMEWVVDAPYGDWRRNFVYRDEVAMGYLPAPIKPWVNRSASAQLLLLLAAAAVFWARTRRPALPGAEGAGDDTRLEGWVFAGLAIWTFLLQVPLSTPVWSLVPELGTVQFPWRFGPFQALTICLLLCCGLAPRHPPAAAAALGMPRRGKGTAAPASGPPDWLHRNPRAVAGFLILAAAPALLLSARLTLNRYPVFTDAVARAPEYYTRVMFEYIPVGVEGWRSFARVPIGLPTATLQGPGQVDVAEWTTHTRRLLVDTPLMDRLTVRTFAFPGWTATLDGQAVAIKPANRTRAISVDVPAGRHTVDLRFEATTDQKVGALLSALSIATMIGFAVWVRVGRRPHAES